jgi:hypothetical protein
VTVLTRDQLAKALNDVAPVVLAFEQLFRNVNENTLAVGTGVESTQALQDATVLTLSANDTLTNERIVQAGRGIQLTDTGAALVIAMIANLIINGNNRLTFNLLADTNLTVIQSGTVMVEESPMANLGNYASDAAAAAGGVPVAGLYHTAGTVKVRLS